MYSSCGYIYSSHEYVIPNKKVITERNAAALDP